MPHIYLFADQKQYEVAQELTDLGGRRDENFRLAFAWDARHYFELTETDEGRELFDKWFERHCPGCAQDAAAALDDSPQEKADATAAPAQDTDAPSAPDAVQTAQPDPVVTPETRQSANPEEPETSVSEPPAESTEDAAADAQESTTDGINEKPEEASETVESSDSSTSGTTRKRSAKNSSRRA